MSPSPKRPCTNFVMLISRSFLSLTSSMIRCIEMQRKMEKSSTGVFSVNLKLYPGRYEVDFNDCNEFDIILCYPVMYRVSFICPADQVRCWWHMENWSFEAHCSQQRTRKQSSHCYIRACPCKVTSEFERSTDPMWLKDLQVLLSWKFYQAVIVI